MAFEIKPGRYFIGFWYFDMPASHPRFGPMGPFGRGGNFSLMVWREGDNGNGRKVDWHVTFRHRYYRDDRIHDHEDVMSWSEYHVPDQTAEEMEETTSKLTTTMAAAIDEIYDFFPIHGDSDEFQRRVTIAPPRWMHFESRVAK